jgi:hypothetical protein
MLQPPWQAGRAATTAANWSNKESSVVWSSFNWQMVWLGLDQGAESAHTIYIYIYTHSPQGNIYRDQFL